MGRDESQQCRTNGGPSNTRSNTSAAPTRSRAARRANRPCSKRFPPTPRLHAKFFAAIGVLVENQDPSNKLLDVETQLGWLRAIGFADVDCYWKWREFGLLVGHKEG